MTWLSRASLMLPGSCFLKDREHLRARYGDFRVFDFAIGIEVTGVKQPAVIDVSHRGKDVFAKVGMILLPFGNGFADTATDRSRAQRTTARHNRDALALDVSFGEF